MRPPTLWHCATHSQRPTHRLQPAAAAHTHDTQPASSNSPSALHHHHAPRDSAPPPPPATTLRPHQHTNPAGHQYINPQAHLTMRCCVRMPAGDPCRSSDWYSCLRSWVLVSIVVWPPSSTPPVLFDERGGHRYGPHCVTSDCTAQTRTHNCSDNKIPRPGIEPGSSA